MGAESRPWLRAKHLKNKNSPNRLHRYPPLQPAKFGEFGNSETEKNLQAFNVFPNPVKAGHPVFVHFALTKTTDLVTEGIDVSARWYLLLPKYGIAGGTYTFTLPASEDLLAGSFEDGQRKKKPLPEK